MDESKINKEFTVTIRFTEAEHADLVEKVKKAQCKNKSDFIRRVVSGVVVKERIPKELRHNLAGVANNLNQLTRMAHAKNVDTVIINEILLEIKAMFQS